MYLYCITSFNMKTRYKVLTALAVLSFFSNLYVGLDWRSWLCGLVVGYVYNIWVSNTKGKDHA